MSEPSCSEQSCAANEGLAGTAAQAPTWLLLEYPGEWRPKAYEQAVLPDVCRAAIDAAVAAGPGLRVQLIRRAERRLGESGFKLFLARTERAREQLWELTVADYNAIAQLDLVGWAQGRDPFAEQRRARPLYLVCVHGKRDRCCAQKGMPVYRALAALRAEETWQTTHLGGHRFAATLVCLPNGVCYGRVEETETAALVSHQERGELYDLDRYRGRACDDSVTQAAEMLLRKQLGSLSIAALAPLPVHVSGEKHEPRRVTFRDAEGHAHTITITRELLPAIQQSCDVAERKPALRWIRA